MVSFDSGDCREVHITRLLPCLCRLGFDTLTKHGVEHSKMREVTIVPHAEQHALIAIDGYISVVVRWVDRPDDAMLGKVCKLVVSFIRRKDVADSKPSA